jgi:hypothetical protein
MHSDQDDEIHAHPTRTHAPFLPVARVVRHLRRSDLPAIVARKNAVVQSFRDGQLAQTDHIDLRIVGIGEITDKERRCSLFCSLEDLQSKTERNLHSRTWPEYALF